MSKEMQKAMTATDGRTKANGTQTSSHQLRPAKETNADPQKQLLREKQQSSEFQSNLSETQQLADERDRAHLDVQMLPQKFDDENKGSENGEMQPLKLTHMRWHLKLFFKILSQEKKSTNVCILEVTISAPMQGKTICEKRNLIGRKRST